MIGDHSVSSVTDSEATAIESVSQPLGNDTINPQIARQADLSTPSAANVEIGDRVTNVYNNVIIVQTYFFFYFTNNFLKIIPNCLIYPTFIPKSPIQQIW